MIFSIPFDCTASSNPHFSSLYENFFKKPFITHFFIPFLTKIKP